MKKVVNVIRYILVFICLLMFFSTRWSLVTYGDLQMEEIVFYLTGPLGGTEKGILSSYVNISLIPCIIVFLIILIIIKLIYKEIKDDDFIVDLKIHTKNIKFTLKNVVIKIIINILLLIMSLLCVWYAFDTLSFPEYVKDQITHSDFIQYHYVDAKDTKLTFPKKKRNLIFIYVESLESTYTSKKNGGSLDYDSMPGLTKLALDNKNVNFSGSNKIGGAMQATGLSWSTAGIIATTAGIPTKISDIALNNGEVHNVLSGVYNLGDILKDNGYNNEVIMGSDSNFGSRRDYFKHHGNYKIFDYNTAKKLGKIPKDYSVWWGYEDSKLFEYSKEEVSALADKDEPFNFTIITANTHSSQGYTEDSCQQKYVQPYANAILCSTNQIAEFVSWAKKQDFYKNTTIVITGDHLSMDVGFFEDINKDDRRVFDLFINSAVTTEHDKNRKFMTIDLFPTTLASLGVKIDGNKLGLGVNLFSGEKTLTEEYGLEEVDKQFRLNSTFYTYKLASDEEELPKKK